MLLDNSMHSKETELPVKKIKACKSSSKFLTKRALILRLFNKG
jgi:hypothetical protein